MGADAGFFVNGTGMSKTQGGGRVGQAPFVAPRHGARLSRLAMLASSLSSTQYPSGHSSQAKPYCKSSVVLGGAQGVPTKGRNFHFQTGSMHAVGLAHCMAHHNMRRARGALLHG